MHTRLVRILVSLAIALPAAAQINIQRTATGNISNGNVAVGTNTTLTVASGGNLTAASGSTVTLGGNTTVSGNVTTNATVTNGSVLSFANVSGSGYSAPLRWGGGNKYTLAGGTATFNSVQDYNGGIEYNHDRVAGDVVFNLMFEHRYDNGAQGVDTEFYYNWDKPVGTSTDAGGVASRRIFQGNVSWGSAGNAPVSKPTGWAQWSFDVNKFTVDNGSNFNGEFAIDFTSSPKRLTWQNAMTLGGALTIGGAITQSGTNTNALSGATTITGSNAVYTFASSATDALATVRSDGSGDAAVRLVRPGTSNAENITLGAAGGGALFGTLSGAFALQRTGAPTIRDLYFRRYNGTTYTQDGRLTAAGLWILGTGSDDTVNRLQVYGNGLFTADNGNTVRILNSALSAGNAAIWLNDAGSPSASNYALLGTSTNTILNSPGGSILFRDANVTRATLNSTGFLVDLTTQATSTTAASLQTDGGLGVVKKSFFGDDIALVPETDSTSSIFLSGTTVASNPGIWLKQGTPSGTNYALIGAATTTSVNVASGGTLRLAVANGNYVSLTASSLRVENVPITMPSTDGTGYLQVVEQASSPAAGAANSARIYAKDNGSGKTQLIVRFASGAEQVLATEP